MAASYEEFAAQQRAEHLNPFNRWCAVVGNYGSLAAVIPAVFGRPRAAAEMFALAQLVIVAGHVVEGNLFPQGPVVARHPLWALRADIAIANETITGLVRRT